MNATGDVIMVHGGDSAAATRRTSRTMEPSAKLQEQLQEKSQAVGKNNDTAAKTPYGGNEGKSELVDEAGQPQGLDCALGNNLSLMQTILRAMLHETSAQLIGEQKKMFERLWKALMGSQQTATQMMGDQLEMIRQLQQRLNEQSARQLRVMREQMNEQIKTIREQSAKELEQMREEVMRELAKAQVQATEETKQVKEEVHGAQTSPQPSYADVARTPPTSQPSNVRTLSSMRTTPSSFTDTPFCTIDMSRISEEDRVKAQVGEVRQAIEEKVRTRDGQKGWRCAAVVRDVGNADLIKVVCRDEKEVQLVKEVAEKVVVKGARVLRGQLYPIKVDGANRTAVLDSPGNILRGAAEALGEENEVTIAKMHWLSNKKNGKMYGSMVIYLTKASDARRPLEERYFHLAGESGSTNVFERRQGLAHDEESVRRRVIVIETAKPSSQSAFCVVVHMSRRVKTVGCGNYISPMATNLRIFQLNVHKSDAVQLNMMNDKDFQDYAVLVVAEPYAPNIEGSVVTTPNSHRDWINTGKRTDIVLAGGFNRRDQLWVGDEVTAELAEEKVRCGIHPTEHGLDHRAIRTEFDLTTPERTAEPRLLFKNVPWNAIREIVKDKLAPLPTYTFWRNLARARRRTGQRIDNLEDRARGASKEYHDAIRRQKKAPQNDFLADGTNICHAAKEQTGRRRRIKSSRQKPGKSDYKQAKAWRPISPLSALGKILEAVVADRISYAVETYELLPADRFGPRKRRSAEQALLLFQEQVYKAWRNRKVVSLVSFDVKGAYNGVFKDRFLQRLEAREIPKRLAGLPQGSPPSPILFLFFNADQVQSNIDANGGSIAFVDDYSAWVTGPTAEDNREGIQAIIDRALAWERCSEATFECDKTAIFHFTCVIGRTSRIPFTMKGEVVKPKQKVKLLGVIMDTKLRFKKHMAEVAARGLSAAMCLRRLKMLSPRTTRQLLVATNGRNSSGRSGSDYPDGVRTACSSGPEAVRQHQDPTKDTSAGSTQGVDESEIHVTPEKADACTRGRGIERMETVHAYAVPLWCGRVSTVCESDHETATAAAKDVNDIIIATSASDRRGLVGIGGVVVHRSPGQADKTVARYSITVGSRHDQNSYTAELEAIAMALRCMPDGLQCRQLTAFSSSQSALKAIARPRQQSGQATIRQFYEHMKRLAKGHNRVKMMWILSRDDDRTLGREAKRQAQRAIRAGCTPQSPGSIHWDQTGSSPTASTTGTTR
ncbi:hypothetical protein FSARC_1871 [Fusarium sarcochroum]|uniref:Reverse transcriptase domain-containing protein n=1 Tax=Fusarium sarcochroum TaxID=1208366 RepID=A0A8H4U834_9HYPO|nr:hypothetical protein FSARC_1871 [Fusarium sarcochroum]